MDNVSGRNPVARTTSRARGRLFPPLFSHLHFAMFVTFFWCGQCGGWGVEAPRGSIFLVFVYVSGGALCLNKERCVGCFGGGLEPQQGTVRWLFWCGHVHHEQLFASQGFFVVPKTELGTSIIPFGVRHYRGGWGLGHRALFVVLGRAHIACTGVPPINHIKTSTIPLSRIFMSNQPLRSFGRLW